MAGKLRPFQLPMASNYLTIIAPLQSIDNVELEFYLNVDIITSDLLDTNHHQLLKYLFLASRKRSVKKLNYVLCFTTLVNIKDRFY